MEIYQVRFCKRGWRSDSPLDSNPTIKRRKGGMGIVGSITDDTCKEVLRILRRFAPREARKPQKPTPTR
jgi:hypothetical protein